MTYFGTILQPTLLSGTMCLLSNLPTSVHRSFPAPVEMPDPAAGSIPRVSRGSGDPMPRQRDRHFRVWRSSGGPKSSSGGPLFSSGGPKSFQWGSHIFPVGSQNRHFFGADFPVGVPPTDTPDTHCRSGSQKAPGTPKSDQSKMSVRNGCFTESFEVFAPRWV